jgi:hypothetical protein
MQEASAAEERFNWEETNAYDKDKTFLDWPRGRSFHDDGAL